MVKMRDRARVSSLVGRTRPELLYCKIGVFMAAASDKTDHVWKRRGCTEIEKRERGGEGGGTRGEEEQRAKVSGRRGRAGKESMKWKHNGMQPQRTKGGRRPRCFHNGGSAKSDREHADTVLIAALASR